LCPNLSGPLHIFRCNPEVSPPSSLIFPHDPP
jgi:hypothetical protein